MNNLANILDTELAKTQQAGAMSFDNSLLGKFKGASGFADKLQTGLGAFAGITNGVTSIASNAMSAAEIQETPEFDAQVEALNALGTTDFTDYNQLIGGYSSMKPVQNQTFDSVRGMTGWEKAGNIGSSALSGFTSGVQVGGIWGGLAGAVLGAGASLFGILSGDDKARWKVREDNLNAQIAEDNALTNLHAETEEVRNRKTRQMYANRRAFGGQIKQMNAREYASKVLGNGDVYFPTREYCKGGLKVRIKV